MENKGTGQSIGFPQQLLMISITIFSNLSFNVDNQNPSVDLIKKFIFEDSENKCFDIFTPCKLEFYYIVGDSATQLSDSNMIPGLIPDLKNVGASRLKILLVSESCFEVV